MRELEFIELLRKVSPPSPQGIGDDAALYNNMLVSTDAVVENIHFTPTTPLNTIFMQLFAANISDIAAMGGCGNGHAVTLAIAIPKSINKKELAQAIIECVQFYDLSLIGGDTVTSRNGLFISMTIIGKPSSNVLLRSNASVGDTVYLSRTTGYQKFYLQNRLNGMRVEEKCDNFPERVLGEFLGNSGVVSACIDISDGLGIDLNRIATASGVQIVLNGDEIPLPDLGLSQSESFSYAISSGEEYALAFTVPAEHAPELERQILEQLNRTIFRIGEVQEGSGCFVSIDGDMQDISSAGYEHR